MQVPPGTSAEFPRPVAVESLGPEEERLAFEAAADECRALAARFGVLEVKRLAVTAWVQSIGEGGARARVQFEADVVQLCVVTLEPVRARIHEGFELDFRLAPAGAGAQTGDTAADPDAVEPPGAVIDGAFDLGEVIAEYLSLAIDPYPRKPDAEVTWRPAAGLDGNEGKPGGPFKALDRWRGKA